jgi:hypothetical protein
MCGVAKSNFYLCERVEAAGYAHYAMYHTTTARARRFLGVVSKVLKWD